MSNILALGEAATIIESDIESWFGGLSASDSMLACLSFLFKHQLFRKTQASPGAAGRTPFGRIDGAGFRHAGIRPSRRYPPELGHHRSKRSWGAKSESQEVGGRPVV